MNFSEIPRGTIVIKRDKRIPVGHTTGGKRNCSCGSGLRIRVQWTDGDVSWPCSKQLTERTWRGKDALQIN